MPIGPRERHDFIRAEIKGPFLLATDQKNKCSRYVLFAESSEWPDFPGALNLRATQGHGDFPRDCKEQIVNGRNYDASDNAFGAILVPDDSGNIVGMVVYGYMYGRAYVTEGYPVEKAMPYLKQSAGSTDSPDSLYEQ